MTSPPFAWMVSTSAPKVDCAIGIDVSPFQYGVQEPAVAVWRKAIVRCLAPDWADSAAGLSPVQASKYGAKTRSGSGVAASAAPVPERARPTAATVVAAAVRAARKERMRLMSVPVCVGRNVDSRAVLGCCRVRGYRRRTRGRNGLDQNGTRPICGAGRHRAWTPCARTDWTTRVKVSPSRSGVCRTARTVKRGNGETGETGKASTGDT